MSTSVTGSVALVFLLSTLGPLTACKPAGEAPRGLAAGPDAETIAPVGTTGDPAGALGTIRLVTPDGGASPTPTPPDVSAPTGPEPDADASEAPPDPLVDLPAELVSRVRAEPTDDARKVAKKLNKQGLRHHQKLDLGAAVRAYRQALEAWPGHPYANYNLACALALQGDKTQALLHLRILAAIGGDTGAERLRRARTDDDLVSLHDDTTFRGLTGYVPVEVSWSPGTSSPTAAEDIARRLRDAHVPAAAASRAWRKDMKSDTLYVRDGDQRAADVADQILEALGPETKRVASQYLDASRPVVLVLSGDAVAAAGGDDGKVDAWIGARLLARLPGAVEHLHLKRTGFFKWERLEDGGKRVERTGRYHLEANTLDLDYRQVTETPTTGEPDVAVEQGRRSSHTVTVEGGALKIDGVSFGRAQ